MRSLMWTGVFCLLVVELGLTLVLVIPLPRSIRNAIVQQVSKLELKKRFRLPLTGLFFVLCFALLDTANFLSQIYARREEDGHRDAHRDPRGVGVGGIDRHILKEREYKAGRNLYLVGFALTLLFVIGRITELMQEHAELSEKIENLRLALHIVRYDNSPDVALPPNPDDGNKNDDGPKIYDDNGDPVAEGIEMKPIRRKKND